MTDRSVTVRLIAITTQYNEEMRKSGQVTKDLGDQATLTGTRVREAGTGVDAFGDSIQRADLKAKNAKPTFSALGLSIVSLGPALVPIAGFAAGAAGAFGGMATAGILAVGGIKDEMAQGTELGKTYTGQLALLKDNLENLQHTAATGVLGPFEMAVKDLQAQLPFLNTTISTFSTITGNTAVALERGFIGALHTLMPLFTDVGVYVQGLAVKLEQFATGSSMKKFAAWAQAELPQVGQFLQQASEAVVHLAAAIAPLGMTSLSTLTLVARAINTLPLSVLQELIPLLTGAYLGFKAFQGLSVLTNTLGALSARLAAVTVATGESAAAARAASVAYRGMEAAAGPIGIALAVGATVMTLFGNSSHAATQQVDDFENALIQSKGAIDDNILSMTMLTLQHDGLADKAAKSGISLAQLTTAVVGTDAQFNALAKSWQAAGDPSGITLARLAVLHAQFSAGAEKAKQNVAAQTQLNATLNGTAGAAMAVSDQVEELASKYGATTDQVQAYAEQNKLSLDGTEKTTKAFITSADKAALLGSTLDQLKNDAIGLTSPFNNVTTRVKDFTDALAQESILAGGDVVRSQASLQSSLNSLATTLHDSKGAFDAYSQAGLASRSALDSSATAAAKYATSVFQQTQNVQTAVKAYSDWYQATVKTAQAQGVSKAAIDAYLQSVGQLPSQVADALQGTQDAGTKAAAQMTDAMVLGLQSGLKPLVETLDSLIVALGGSVGDAAVSAGQTIGGTVNSAMAETILADTTPESAANAKALRLAYAADGQAYDAGASVGANFNAGLAASLASSPLAPGGSTYNSQVPGTSTSVTKAYAPPPIHIGIPSFGGLRAGVVAPASSGGRSGGSSAATAATTAQANADALLAAQAAALINPTNALALAQQKLADDTRVLNNETKKGTTAYYQQLATVAQDRQALQQAQNDLADAKAKAMLTPGDQVAADQEALAEAVRNLGQAVKGTTAYYQDLATAKQALYTLDQQELQDTQALTQAQQAYQNVMDEEAAATKQHQDDLTKAALDNTKAINALMTTRQQALEQTMSLTQAPVKQWADSIGFLVNNAKTELADFTQWEADLAAARAAGLSDTTIQRLGLDAGPQADAQIQQILKGTPDQIKQLNDTVAQINQAAADEANTEAANNFGQLGAQLAAQQAQYTAAVEQINAQYAAQMAQYAKDAQAAAAALAAAQQKVAQDNAATNGATSSGYQQVANTDTVGPGTALYTRDANGNYVHIPNVPALQALPKGTPIYDKLYDSGGILPPGHTVAYNASGHDEYVFTQQQLATLVGGGGGGDTVVQVFLNDQPLEGVVERVVVRRNTAKKHAMLVGGSR